MKIFQFEKEQTDGSLINIANDSNFSSSLNAKRLKFN